MTNEELFSRVIGRVPRAGKVLIARDRYYEVASERAVFEKDRVTLDILDGDVRRRISFRYDDISGILVPYEEDDPLYAFAVDKALQFEGRTSYAIGGNLIEGQERSSKDGVLVFDDPILVPDYNLEDAVSGATLFEKGYLRNKQANPLEYLDFSNRLRSFILRISGKGAFNVIEGGR